MVTSKEKITHIVNKITHIKSDRDIQNALIPKHKNQAR